MIDFSSSLQSNSNSSVDLPCLSPRNGTKGTDKQNKSGYDIADEAFFKEEDSCEDLALLRLTVCC